MFLLRKGAVLMALCTDVESHRNTLQFDFFDRSMR